MLDMRFARHRTIGRAALVLALTLGASQFAFHKTSARRALMEPFRTARRCLPGVTVTATSPALRCRILSLPTDKGNTDFGSAPRRVSTPIRAQGFQPLVRSGLQLNAGFAMRVDAGLEIGALKKRLRSMAIRPSST